ncbi:MAG: cobalamin-binding protein [Candidatus Riflebacteria bacterium HGW-Riflebacteria-2]|nr:MAG: cobalamin-binding protein [Candidatus Riflebacteria bacterium HGW-Riflebacteria-2]
MNNLLSQDFEKALLDMDQRAATKILTQACEAVEPIVFVEQVVMPALEKIGDDWDKGLIALSQVYMSGRICERLVDTILPPASPNRTSQPAMAIAALNDYHSLGKTIIYSSLRASGYELLDLGRVGVDELVRQTIEHKLRIVLISVLMLPSALHVKQVVERLKQQKCKAKIVVGGAPFRFDQQLWQEVGADATGANIADALKVIHRIMEEMA